MSPWAHGPRITRRQALGLVLIPITLACGGATGAGNGTPTPTPPPPTAAVPGGTPPPTPAATPGPTTTAPAAATPSAPGRVPVRIVDFAFDPPALTVPVGTTVEWTNDGATIHNTVSQTGVWESPILDPGATFRFTFDQPGEHPYWCTIHPTMLGTVTVQ
ncbi:MAG: cupredoxin domain-containing protein [Sphaerobacter sp.]|nr:cupredoxin domain-containing protein [Sphaerobacter sp.]